MVGMVARLADRLKQNGSDAEGWAQLVRSYRALGQNDKAQAAIADARRALAGDPDKLRVFTELPKDRAAPPAAPPAPPAPAHLPRPQPARRDRARPISRPRRNWNPISKMR